MGKQAKLTKRIASQRRAGMGGVADSSGTTAHGPTGSQSQTTAPSSTTPSLPAVKRPAPRSVRPGDPDYRGPRDPVTGEAIGTVDAPYWMRSLLYDATRAALERQLIPTALHAAQMETAEERRAEDAHYAGGAPRFSGDFQRYMKDVLPKLLRETTEQRRRWYDNVYVCEALRRHPRVGPDAVTGLLALLREGADWEAATTLAGRDFAHDASWLWRKLQVVERLLRAYFARPARVVEVIGVNATP